MNIFTESIANVNIKRLRYNKGENNIFQTMLYLLSDEKSFMSLEDNLEQMLIEHMTLWSIEILKFIYRKIVSLTNRLIE